MLNQIKLIHEDPEGFIGGKRNRDGSLDAGLHACDVAGAPAACSFLSDGRGNLRASVHLA
jgi:hypothetical protein